MINDPLKQTHEHKADLTRPAEIQFLLRSWIFLQCGLVFLTESESDSDWLATVPYEA